MIWFVPIEPLEERYTAQMYRWVRSEMDRRNLRYSILQGTALRTVTEAGQFLNWSSTSYYKARQLQQIAELFHQGQVHDGDIFFVGDIWFPGIEMIAYLRDMLHVRCKIYGINYAGPFDPTDLTHPMLYWGGYQEAAWYSMCEKIFVGSRYHKKLIIEGMERWVPNLYTWLESKIVVTGLVWNDQEVNTTPKMELKQTQDSRPMVIWPHRLSSEKNVEGFYDLVSRFQGRGIRWVITSSRAGQTYQPELPGVEFYSVTKLEYYNLLRHASLMLSTSYHENFGYTVREATALGTPVLCPRRADYPEMILSQDNLYASPEEAVVKIIKAVEGRLPVASLRTMGGFPQMLDLMTEKEPTDVQDIEKV